jgi:NADH-quinone oxidoreductase subunit G
MPRPQQRTITFSIDGLEVRAPENAMLVDAAKYGDVEIPVFCYEPKLGQPVGACRMCLVEVEGIPKLQTGCSTAVKDGMVVHTQSERVKVAQRSVVEFLLVNHPLDCPVCDKGGECPLQDITFGYGPGISRFVEPKRHFVKPLELSPLVAIDRERCILCYRCVRFSQEIAEDYQLVFAERGSSTFVATFDGHPYVAPFSGNIVELCPVGALTSRAYRFRARPWDVEDSGSVCTLCPAQCNVSLTVRDERALRVLARENDQVDDGWLCDKGRFGYQAIHVDERVAQPLLRDAGRLRPVSWERALSEAARGLSRAGARTAALAGGQATSEEGFLLGRVLREGLGSSNLDCRRAGALELDLLRALAAPELQARTSDLEFAHAVLVLDCEPLDDAPILDLRVRKGVRRHDVALAVATPQASALDPRAALSLRFAPGGAAAFLRALLATLHGSRHERLARDAGADPGELHRLAGLLTGGQGALRAGAQVSEPREVVVLWGERLTAGPNGAAAARALLSLASALRLAATDGAGLLEVPAFSNGRGLREAGMLPNAGPGLLAPHLRAPGERNGADGHGGDAAGPVGDDASEIARRLGEGELDALYLLQCDPLLELPGAESWQRGLDRAQTVIAHAAFLTDAIAEHADVVFPAESYAEKEGTVVHPDGRLQRLRPAIARPGAVKAGWSVIASLALGLGLDLGVHSAAGASSQLFEAVPFYSGLTLEEIGGRGVRWQERDAASQFPAAQAADAELLREEELVAPGADAQDLAGYRSLWQAPEVEFSPALRFLARRAPRPGPALEVVGG